MKKRLFAILLALTLALTLLPVTAYADDEGSADLGTIKYPCDTCKTNTNWKILKFIKSPIAKYDPDYHWIRIQCPNCNRIDEVHPSGALGSHSGGTETPTCTTGKTCEKCGGEYGKLGHDWGAWQSKGDNKTHIRTCKRDGCDAVETEDCGGDGTATCVTAGTCAVCGGPYYGGHNFAKYWDSDANTHWYPCLNENCEERKDVEDHWFVQSHDKSLLKSEATCISPAVYYENCAYCLYKGTNTFVDTWWGTNPNNHDGGTEVKNAKAATCTEKGYTGDTHCKGCGVKLSDGTDTPALDHNWGKWTSNGDGTHTRVCSRDKSHSENGKCSGGKADCCHKAKCEVCGGAYGSLASDNHSDLKHFPPKRATTHAEGNTEYWYCSGCGKYYKDAGATKEITQKDTVIRKRRSSSGSTTDDKTIESPKTGDAGIVLYIGMAALSLTGGVWLRRKEQ